MNDIRIEGESQSTSLASPRVPLATIEEQIHSEHYFTAWDGAAGAAIRKASESGDDEATIDAPEVLGLMTCCTLVMRNGFVVLGKSYCVNADRFDPELGRQAARQDALGLVLPLMNYELRTAAMGAQDA